MPCSQMLVSPISPASVLSHKKRRRFRQLRRSPKKPGFLRGIPIRTELNLILDLYPSKLLVSPSRRIIKGAYSTMVYLSRLPPLSPLYLPSELLDSITSQSHNYSQSLIYSHSSDDSYSMASTMTNIDGFFIPRSVIFLRPVPRSPLTLGSRAPAILGTGRDPSVGLYELRLSPALGEFYAEKHGITLHTPEERQFLFSNIYPQLSKWLGRIKTENGWTTSSSARDCETRAYTSPCYHGEGSLSAPIRTTTFKIPALVGENLSIDNRDVAWHDQMVTTRRHDQVITGGGYPLCEQILFILQLVLPGMVWFQRVDGTPEECGRIVCAQRVNPEWMRLNKKKLVGIVGKDRYTELARVIMKEWEFGTRVF